MLVGQHLILFLCVRELRTFNDSWRKNRWLKSPSLSVQITSLHAWIVNHLIYYDYVLLELHFDKYSSKVHLPSIYYNTLYFHIFYTCFIQFSHKGLEPIPAATGERRRTHRTGRQSITGPGFKIQDRFVCHSFAQCTLKWNTVPPG